jgi:hypothetical protein
LRLERPKDHFYCPSDAQEAASSADILFPLPAESKKIAGEVTPAVSDRKFTFDEVVSPQPAVSEPAPAETEAPEEPIEELSALSLDAAPSPGFKARALPSSHAAPTIQPRITKAAALRMGIALPATERKAQSQEVDMTTPGVNKRPVAVLPKSLGSPRTPVRSTKASALRAGDGSADKRPAVRMRESSGTSERSAASCFQDVPGAW